MHKLVPVNARLIPDAATKVFGGVIYDTYQWQQQQFDGNSLVTFEMLKRSDSVRILCVDEKRELIAVLEDDQPHRGTVVTFPGGRVDADDTSPQAAAARELAEEAGVICSHWRLVECRQPEPKIEWFVYTFVAYGPLPANVLTHQDAGERITLRWLDFGAVKDMVMSGEGFLVHAQPLLGRLDCLRDVLELPEFTGRVVDR